VILEELHHLILVHLKHHRELLEWDWGPSVYEQIILGACLENFGEADGGVNNTGGDMLKGA
jgi:hypothetical protein